MEYYFVHLFKFYRKLYHRMVDIYLNCKLKRNRGIFMVVRSEMWKIREVLGNFDTYKINSTDLWTERAYESFVDNLRKADNDFYLGTMILESQDLTVVDGTCRLIACYAVLIAIRDLAVEIDTELSNELSNYLDSIYLVKNCDRGKKFLDIHDSLDEHLDKRVAYLKNNLRMDHVDRYMYYKALKDLGNKILNCSVNVICAEFMVCLRMMSDINIIPSQKELNLELDI